jgi:hypothetical protein
MAERDADDATPKDPGTGAEGSVKKSVPSEHRIGWWTLIILNVILCVRK